MLGVAERARAVRPVVADVGADVEPFQRLPVHAGGDGVVAGGGTGGAEGAAGGEAVAVAVQGGGDAAWGADPEAVLVAEPFATDTGGEVVHHVVGEVGVDAVPFGVGGHADEHAVGEAVVVLEHEVHLVGDVVLGDDAVHGPVFGALLGGAAVGAADVDGGVLVGGGVGGAHKAGPVAEVLVPAAVPAAGGAAGDDAAHDGPVGVDGVVAHHAGVGERFAVLHGVGVGVEEVVGGGHGFVADGGVEVPGFNIQAVADGDVGFEVGLRDGEVVEAVVVRAEQVEVPVVAAQGLAGIDIKSGHAVGLGEDGVGAEHDVEAPADVELVAFGGDGALEVEVELVQLEFALAVAEGDGAVEAVVGGGGVVGDASVGPTAHFKAAVFHDAALVGVAGGFKQGRGFGQALGVGGAY